MRASRMEFLAFAMATPPAVHIIDDDAAVRDSVAALLEVRGVPVVTYASARAFLDALAHGDVEGCVVTDVQMPGMTGLELLAALRDRRYDLPVIVASARGGQAMAAEAMAHGATALLDKPFDPDDFVTTVTEALGLG